MHKIFDVKNFNNTMPFYRIRTLVSPVTVDTENGRFTVRIDEYRDEGIIVSVEKQNKYITFISLKELTYEMGKEIIEKMNKLQSLGIADRIFPED